MNTLKYPMKKLLKQTLLIIATLITITSQVQASSDTKKVLMVVSGNGQNEKEGEEVGGRA